MLELIKYLPGRSTARLARQAELVEASSRRAGLNMFTVYILKSVTAKKSYVGMTDNLDRRLAEHNSGKHFYTKRYKPWFVFYTEKFATRFEARSREVYFKSSSGRRFLKKIFTNS